MIETEVEIYGKKYTLRGTSGEEIQAVAKSVDQRMKELFGPEPRLLDPSRMFALAINFAEEIYQLQLESGKEEREIQDRLERVVRKLAILEKMVEL